MNLNAWAIKALVFAGISFSCITAATVTIDMNKRYQTIEGFGSFGGMNPLCCQAAPYWTNAFADKMINDLGVSVIRTGWADNGTNDLMKYMYDRGIKVIASVWDPLQAKINGHMDPSRYAAFSDAAVAYVNRMQGLGVQLYAFSPQNEPFFEPSYGGCIYSPEEMHSMLRILGPKWKTAGLDTKTRIFYAEDMLMNNANNRGHLTQTCGDTVTRKYVHAFAVHGYQTDGVTATSNAALNGLWASLYYSRVAPSCATKYNIPLWMTETSGYVDNWLGNGTMPGGFALGYAIYSGLRYGKMSLWTYWQTSERGGSEYVMIDGNTQTQSKRWNASKHFFKYIRPGAVMIDCALSDTGAGAVAFAHAANRTFTVVLINAGSAAASVTLRSAIPIPASFAGYRTSGSEDFTSIGTVSAATAISLPATSITTLYAENFVVPTVGTVMKPSVHTANNLTAALNPAALYSVDGRRIGLRSGMNAKGVAVAVGKNRATAAVIVR